MFADRVDLVRFQAVGVSVDGVGVLGAIGFDETEDPSRLLVDPIPKEAHPVLTLSLYRPSTQEFFIINN